MRVWAWASLLLASHISFSMPGRAQEPGAVRDQSSFPSISILEPRNGIIVTRMDQPIVISFRDPQGEVDTSTFRVLVNGVDRTHQFQVTPSGATWRPQPRGGREVGPETPGSEAQPVLTEGQNVIVASIKNVAGNLGTASTAFVLDTSALRAGRAASRSSIERSYLLPPSLPLSETQRGGAPMAPSISRDLVQFGYEALQTLLPKLAPATNLPVSPGYTLGPGDRVILDVWNIPGTALYDSTTLVVDRTGSVFVPRVGSVPLQGLTLAQAQEILRTKLGRYYAGFELRLALAELRGIEVYVVGEVARPGIYELQPTTSVGGLIAMAGGPLPTAQLGRLQVERVQGVAGKIILDLPVGTARDGGESQLLWDGDLVKVFPAQDWMNNAVSLEGFVRTPGEFQWRPDLRLSDLLRPEILLPEAYPNRVEVIRVRPDFTREVLTIDLHELWSSKPMLDPARDLILRPLDRISVQSEVVGPALIRLRGEVKRPGAYFITKGERLSSVIRRAGGFTDKAYPKAAVFTRESVRQKERVQISEFVREQEARLMADTTALSAGAEQNQVALLREYMEQRRALLRLLVERAAVGRVILRLGELDQIEGSESDIHLEDGDVLSVPLRPSTVLVAGSVRNPAAILYQPGAPAEYYLEKAGGLSRDADKDETYILKADGSAVRGYTKVREMEPGDAILVPPSVEMKYRPLPFWRDIATIFGQFGLTAASVVTIFK